MRFVCVSLSLLITAGIHASAAEVTAATSCGTRLRDMMSDDENVRGQCDVVVTDGVNTVKKTFQAEVVEGPTAGEAQLQLKEFCDKCKTEGTTTLHAMDFERIASWVAQNAARELRREPDPGALSNDCSISNDAAPTTTDLMSCRVKTLRAKRAVAEADEYFLKHVQPRLQKLAIMKDRANQTLLRQTLSELGNLKLANASPAVAEVMQQFDLYNRTVDDATTFENAMKTAANSPEARNALNGQWQALKQERVAQFVNRSRVLKTQGVTDQVVLANSDLLASAVKTLGYPGGNAPDATSVKSNPRGTFGTPMQGRGTPGGFAPPKGGGVPGNMFHAS